MLFSQTAKTTPFVRNKHMTALAAPEKTTSMAVRNRFANVACHYAWVSAKSTGFYAKAKIRPYECSNAHLHLNLWELELPGEGDASKRYVFNMC